MQVVPLLADNPGDAIVVVFCIVSATRVVVKLTLGPNCQARTKTVSGTTDLRLKVLLLFCRFVCDSRCV